MRYQQRSIIQITGSILMLSFIINCGSPRTGSKSKGADEKADGDDSEAIRLDCGESSHDNNTTKVRLKGAALVAKTFQAALGDGITKDPISGGDLLDNESIVQNFGTSRDGIYADVKSEDQAMAAYLMSLNYVGRTAAVNCATRNFEGLCQCDTDETATALLQRAITFRRFCSGTDDPYIQNLVTLCKKSPTDGITSVMTSIAITLLQ